MLKIFCIFIFSIMISCSTQIPSSEIITLNSGLKFRDLVIGSGSACKKADKITINYLVKNSDSVEIENTWSSGRPMTFTVGNNETIKGIDEGVLKMKRGGKRELFVPEELGFFDEKYSKKNKYR